MTLKRYIRTISPYTIFFFASVKLILVALMDIFFHSQFVLAKHFTYFQKLSFSKYAMLAIGIVGLFSLKYQKFQALMALSIFYCFWWIYTALGLGINTQFKSLHFVSLAFESCAMVYLFYRVNRDKILIH